MTTEDTGRKSKENSGDVTVLVEADQSDDRVVCVDHLLTERPLLQQLLGDVGGQNGTVRTFVITDTIATLAVLEEYLHS